MPTVTVELTEEHTLQVHIEANDPLSAACAAHARYQREGATAFTDQAQEISSIAVQDAHGDWSDVRPDDLV